MLLAHTSLTKVSANRREAWKFPQGCQIWPLPCITQFIFIYILSPLGTFSATNPKAKTRRIGLSWLPKAHTFMHRIRSLALRRPRLLELANAFLISTTGGGLAV